MTLTLVLGGARSGKSGYAQREAEARPGRLVMIVTAEAHDAEMEARIALHRKQRGIRWTTVEAPLNLAAALYELRDSDVAVVDCLTLWMSNLLMHQKNIETHTAELMAALTAELMAALEDRKVSIWLVSNEVSMGIVPENALARKFRDEIGRLHQDLARLADQVVMMVAGIPLKIK